MGRKHLVLIGGGHAHMVTLAKLHTFIEKGHRVTVIGPSSTIITIPAWGRGCWAKPIHRTTSGLKPGMWWRNRAEHLSATRRLASRPAKKRWNWPPVRRSTTMSFPSMPAAMSPALISPKMPGTSMRSNPLERLMEAQARILELAATKRVTIGILGGGPSSAEVAGNIWQLTRHIQGSCARGEDLCGPAFYWRASLTRFPPKSIGCSPNGALKSTPTAMSNPSEQGR